LRGGGAFTTVRAPGPVTKPPGSEEGKSVMMEGKKERAVVAQKEKERKGGNRPIEGPIVEGPGGELFWWRLREAAQPKKQPLRTAPIRGGTGFVPSSTRPREYHRPGLASAAGLQADQTARPDVRRDAIKACDGTACEGADDRAAAQHEPGRTLLPCSPGWRFSWGCGASTRRAAQPSTGSSAAQRQPKKATRPGGRRVFTQLFSAARGAVSWARE